MASAANIISFAELDSLEGADYAARLQAVVPEPAEETIAKLTASIVAFEAKHRIDSATMRRRLASGELDETLDVCDWLMALDLRTRLATSTAHSA